MLEPEVNLLIVLEQRLENLIELIENLEYIPSVLVEEIDFIKGAIGEVRSSIQLKVDSGAIVGEVMNDLFGGKKR